MVTEFEDYIEDLQTYFPYFSKSELKEIILYGLKKYIYANKFGADITLFKRDSDPIIIHTGRLGLDTLTHYFRWVTKYRMKERVLYKLRKAEWDGYYYIGLNEEDHQKMLKQKGKTKVFRKVYPTKIMRELYHNKLIKHIWQIPYPIDNGFKFFTEKLTTKEAKYIGENQYEKYHQCFLGRNRVGCSSTDEQADTTN